MGMMGASVSRTLDIANGASAVNVIARVTVKGDVVGWFDRLRNNRFAPKEERVTTVLSTVKAHPKRPGLKPPAVPKKQGKAPEQWESEMAAYRLAMRRHFAGIAAFERERRIALGIKSYQWKAVDVHGSCDIAKRNDGKVFPYDAPPAEGHVGEGECHSPDWCRCISRPIVPGFS